MKSHTKAVNAWLMVGAVVAVFGTGHAMGSNADVENPQTKTTPPEAQMQKAKMAEVEMPKSLYACAACEAVAEKAGRCEHCGKDMVPKHVLGTTEDGKVMLCDCPADCACDAKGVKDGKCACGKEVTTMKKDGLTKSPEDLAKKEQKAAEAVEQKLAK